MLSMALKSGSGNGDVYEERSKKIPRKLVNGRKRLEISIGGLRYFMHAIHHHFTLLPTPQQDSSFTILLLSSRLWFFIRSALDNAYKVGRLITASPHKNTLFLGVLKFDIEEFVVIFD